MPREEIAPTGRVRMQADETIGEPCRPTSTVDGTSMKLQAQPFITFPKRNLLLPLYGFGPVNRITGAGTCNSLFPCDKGTAAGRPASAVPKRDRARMAGANWADTTRMPEELVPTRQILCFDLSRSARHFFHGAACQPRRLRTSVPTASHVMWDDPLVTFEVCRCFG
jgi:hypothetical protein